MIKKNLKALSLAVMLGASVSFAPQALSEPADDVQLKGQAAQEDQAPPEKPKAPLQGSVQLQDQTAPPVTPGVVQMRDLDGSTQIRQGDQLRVEAPPQMMQPDFQSGQARMARALMRMFLSNPNFTLRANSQFIDPSLYGVCGVTVTVRRNDFPTVTTVFSGTNAIAAGIRPGDKIMAVNDVSMYGVSHQSVWNHLTGKPGSQVHLSLARGDMQYDTDVIRTDIMHIASNSTRQLFMSQYRTMGKSPLSEP